MTEREELQASLVGFDVPAHIHGALTRYVLDHAPVGDFLYAVLTNNLSHSFGRADPENRAHLFDIVMWVWNEVPGDCWGSESKVDAWLAQRPAIAATRATHDAAADAYARTIVAVATAAAAPATEICGVWMCSSSEGTWPCGDQGQGSRLGPDTFHAPENNPRWQCQQPHGHDGPHVKEPEHDAA